MKKTVLDAQDVKSLAPWFKNETIINALLRWLNVERVNKLHSDNCHMQGADFTDGILRDLNIKLEIEDADDDKCIGSQLYIGATSLQYRGCS